MRSGPGEARTILLLHIISVGPSKQPLMVRIFLKVYMELGSSFLFLQEQIKDIIIIILTPPLPKGLRRKLFLTVLGVRYRRDRVRSSRKGDGGLLASTNWPPMPPCSRDGWPKGRPLTRNSALSSRECCRILQQMSHLSSTTR